MDATVDVVGRSADRYGSSDQSVLCGKKDQDSIGI